MDEIKVPAGGSFILHPNTFALASTVEYMSLPDNLSAKVEGKSTLARMGILVHTAGFVDPGFDGTITLELSNQANLPIIIYPGMYICQMDFHMMSSPAEISYKKRKKSLYSKSVGPKGANTGNLFEKNRPI
jgi:dCTP deaminase